MNEFSAAAGAELEAPRVRHAFDRAADTYDQAAALQRRVADHLLARIPALTPAAVLDAGCGTGYVTAALRQRFPAAQLTALDLAPGMLRATAQRVPQASLMCCDIQHLPVAMGSFDLVCSSLMLQWCNRLDLAFAGVQRSLRPGGAFHFSTFGPTTLHELRESFSDGRTHVSHFPTAEAIRQQLEAAGFTAIEIERGEEVLHYPDARSLMQELKAIGAHNATSGRSRGLTGRKAWQAMLANYESRRVAAGLPATYALIYVAAGASA